MALALANRAVARHRVASSGTRQRRACALMRAPSTRRAARARFGLGAGGANRRRCARRPTPTVPVRPAILARRGFRRTATSAPGRERFPLRATNDCTVSRPRPLSCAKRASAAVTSLAFPPGLRRWRRLLSVSERCRRKFDFFRFFFETLMCERVFVCSCAYLFVCVPRRRRSGVSAPRRSRSVCFARSALIFFFQKAEGVVRGSSLDAARADRICFRNEFLCPLRTFDVTFALLVTHARENLTGR